MPYLDDTAALDLANANLPAAVNVSPKPQGRVKKSVPERLHYLGNYATRIPAVRDPRIKGSTETNVKTEVDTTDRHELFLLADGEKKVEMETVTRE